MALFAAYDILLDASKLLLAHFLGVLQRCLPFPLVLPTHVSMTAVGRQCSSKCSKVSAVDVLPNLLVLYSGVVGASGFQLKRIQLSLFFPTHGVVSRHGYDASGCRGHDHGFYPTP